MKLTKVNKEDINGYPMEIINKGFARTLPFMYNEYGGMDGFIADLERLIYNISINNYGK